MVSLPQHSVPSRFSVNDFPTVDTFIHDSRRLATLDDSFTMDNFKRLPAHVHSTAYILYETTTRAFDCPLKQL